MSAKRKVTALVTACAFVMVVGAQTAFAAGRPDASCTDANGNGMCDTAVAVTRTAYVDADGDGVCDNLGSGVGRDGSWERGNGQGRNDACGQGYVDEDGDGACDNAGVGARVGSRRRADSGFHGGR